MRDRYQPGHELVLPSGRRVVIVRVYPGFMACAYVAPRGRGGSEVDLARHFCDRHCLLVEAVAA